MKRINFDDQIKKNKRDSFLWMVSISLVILAFGYIIAQLFGEEYSIIILFLSVLFSIFYPLIIYNNSASIAVSSVGAKKMDRNKDRDIYNLVEGLTIASGLPMPKLYVMKSNQINAFASGKDPKNAVICLTTGAIEKLDRRELEAVISHELSHIANYDIRYMTLVSVMVGMVSIISDVFLRSLFFRKSDDKKGDYLVVIGLLLAIFSPIFVALVQMAISRKREYAADATAVKFTRYPRALANALRKIKDDSIVEKKVSKAVSPLFFANPLGKITSTHPPIEDRIKVLESM
jgi:heat shock protein HtpX